MDCSGHPHRSNVRYLTAAVAGTLLVYAARWVAADEDDQHLRWRCPVPMSAALFTIGQLGGVAAVAFKDGPCSLRGRDEPPAAVPLRLYMCVSVTSSVMLGFVLLWAGGIFPQPRCLSGSAACLQLRDNLEQTGWITAALCGLAACQLMGAVAAGRSLCCPGFIGDTGGGGPTLVREMDPTQMVRPLQPQRPVGMPPVGVVLDGQPVVRSGGGFGSDHAAGREQRVVEGVVI